MSSTKRYRIRYRKSAKQEAGQQYYLGQSFVVQFQVSLKEIAEDCANKDTTRSVDYLEMLEDSVQFTLSGTSKTRIKQQWRHATPLEKIKALIYTIKHRKLPWEIRSEVFWIHNILNSFSMEVQCIYEIDHVNKQVVFVSFSFCKP